MRKVLFAWMALILPISFLSAQEIGLTLIDGTTINGRINYNTLTKTPDKIEVEHDGQIVVYTPSMVKEFKVYGDRFISREIELNTTDQNLQTLKKFNELEWVKKEVFLKVLVLGDMSLYSYKDSRVHYFVEKKDQFMELIKLNKSNNTILNRYVGQLSILFADCEKLKKTDYINFKASSLKRAVIAYNDCISGKSDFVEEKVPLEASFYIVGGYKLSLYDLSGAIYGNYELDSQAGTPTFGIGFDLNVLQRTKRLRLYNELLLQSYKFEGFYRDQRQIEQQYIDYFLDVDIQYLEANSMLRFNLGREMNKVKVFLNAGVNVGFQIADNSTEYSNTVFFETQNRRERDPLGGVIKNTRIAFLTGIGIQHKFVALELRYGFNPKLSDLPVVSNTNNINLLAAFKVF